MTATRRAYIAIFILLAGLAAALRLDAQTDAQLSQYFEVPAYYNQIGRASCRERVF